jgi:two-component system NtrC family response regulator
MSVRILVADDDPSLRRVLQFKLKQLGYEVATAEDGESALTALEKSRFDLLLSDVKMPGISGLELIERSRQIQPDLEIILITAHATISTAVEAVKAGAFDYVPKPFEDEELYLAIEKALKFKKLENENRSLRKQLNGFEKHRRPVGASEPFKELLKLIEKIAPTDASVLITGESGSGKELIARSIHDKSHRANKPFIAVNCAAIPKELLESELFGHVKGAFTGAVKDKRGKFELAEGGTLFLDEISELAFELQAKLLRAIQEKVIEPIGSEESREIDIRLIASSNVDLKTRAAENKFREDLFYRLNVVPIKAPSLRERADDIPILIKEFLHRYAPHQKINVDANLIRKLKEYRWPGNIRELENLIERMVILRKSNYLTVDDLPDDFDAPAAKTKSAEKETSDISFHEAEKNIIVNALKKFDWNRSRAAEYLKIPRHILIYRMKKYNLTRRTTEDSDPADERL